MKCSDSGLDPGPEYKNYIRHWENWHDFIMDYIVLNLSIKFPDSAHYSVVK